MNQKKYIILCALFFLCGCSALEDTDTRSQQQPPQAFPTPTQYIDPNVWVPSSGPLIDTTGMACKPVSVDGMYIELRRSGDLVRYANPSIGRFETVDSDKDCNYVVEDIVLMSEKEKELYMNRARQGCVINPFTYILWDGTTVICNSVPPVLYIPPESVASYIEKPVSLWRWTFKPDSPSELQALTNTEQAPIMPGVIGVLSYVDEVTNVYVVKIDRVGTLHVDMKSTFLALP